MFTVDELLHKRMLRCTRLFRRAAGDDLTAGDKINVIDDFQGFEYVVGDDNRSHAQRIVQATDQTADHAQRNRVQPRERFVVHYQHRIERRGARERDAPRHAAGEFAGAQVSGAAQAHGVELHQDEVVNHLLRQVGVFA